MKLFQALKTLSTVSVALALIGLATGCGENQVSGGGLEPLPWTPIQP